LNLTSTEKGLLLAHPAVLNPGCGSGKGQIRKKEFVFVSTNNRVKCSPSRQPRPGWKTTERVRFLFKRWFSYFAL